MVPSCFTHDLFFPTNTSKWVAINSYLSIIRSHALSVIASQQRYEEVPDGSQIVLKTASGEKFHFIDGMNAVFFEDRKDFPALVMDSCQRFGCNPTCPFVDRITPQV